MGIPAANAELSVVAGEGNRFRLEARAKGNSVTRLLYPLNSLMVSTVESPGVRPSSYERTGKEGWGDPLNRLLLFDREKGECQYWKDGTLRKTLPIPDDVQDPLSLLYAFRFFADLSEGSVVPVKVSDGKSVIEGTVTVLGREEVETPAGTFRAVKVEPSLEGIRGVFRKSPGAHLYVWLTDDRERQPVKVESEVSVGTFTALLVDIEMPPPPPPAPK